MLTNAVDGQPENIKPLPTLLGGKSCNKNTTKMAQQSAHLPHRPLPLTLTFRNSITVSPVAKDVTDKVW